ncbi:hypothetical protein IC617_10555 [Neiella sp. HB171785]|uniref:DUF6701 domain-containing protein n=1 Tax=Neiella litorisoli TaxID=2771431 RepID=A0A8J6QSF1_9GAMM|nr:DUF6701 domain-containing protein [Neiella litorisoli]MBD1389869.1 hypothetical protein [Neiella litorisoli]
MIRQLAISLALFTLLVSHGVEANSCDQVLVKALQGVQEPNNGGNGGAYFTQNNDSAKIHDVGGQQFDFARVRGWLVSQGCNDGSGNEFQCQITEQIGIRGNPAWDLPQNNQADSINAYNGITAYLGVPDWLAPYFSANYLVRTESVYKQMDIGGTVYLWGGRDANQNDRGYIQYSIDRVNHYGGRLSVPPGDLLIAKSFQIPGGSFEPQGNNRPTGWDDFIDDIPMGNASGFFSQLIATLFGGDAAVSQVDRIDFVLDALDRGLQVPSSEVGSYVVFVFADGDIPDSLVEFLWPLDHPSATTRMRLNSRLDINNSAARMNDYSGAKAEYLVVHTNQQMTISGGIFRGALVQANEGNNNQNINLVINNSQATFHGMASVEAGYTMNAGNFYYEPAVKNADFDDICDSVSTEVDLFIDAKKDTALTCEVVDVELRVERGGSTVTDFEGVVSLNTSTSEGSWVGDGYSFNGELNNTSNGNGSYEFVASDNGQVLVGFRHPSIGTVSMEMIKDTTTSEPDSVTFVPEGLAVEFNPEYPTANEPFELIVKAVKPNDSDPSQCVSDINYEGTKNIAFAMRYADSEQSVFVPLTQAAETIPEEGSGTLVRQLNFVQGESVPPLDDVNYRDVGGIEVIASDEDFAAEFPDQAPLTGEGSTIVVPASVTILDVRTQLDGGQCGAVNLQGTATSGAAFTAAGDPFVALVSGLVANCPDSGEPSGSACDPNAVACAAPNFKAPVAISADLDTPNKGSDGEFSGDQPAENDFANGSAVAANLRYDEVGSIILRSEVVDYAGTGIDFSSELVVGRFYPAYLERTIDAVRDLPNAQPGCLNLAAGEDHFSYLSAPNQQLSFELVARARGGEVTENYHQDDDDPDNHYAFTATAPSYLLYDDSTDLSARLQGLPDPLVWQDGIVFVEDDGFTVDRLFTAQTPLTSIEDGPFTRPEIGLSLEGGDGETFKLQDLIYDCGGAACPQLAIELLEAPIAELRYGRLKADDGYSPDSLDLHVPLQVEYWNGSNFVVNSWDSCTELGFAMMSFDPQKDNADAIDIGSGSSTLALTRDRSSYVGSGGTVITQDGRLWIRYTAPNDSGSATHFVGEGGVSSPISPWPEWLKYNWDGDQGASPSPGDDASVSGVATFGRTRGSDRVISRREL